MSGHSSAFWVICPPDGRTDVRSLYAGDGGSSERTWTRRLCAFHHLLIRPSVPPRGDASLRTVTDGTPGIVMDTELQPDSG